MNENHAFLRTIYVTVIGDGDFPHLHTPYWTLWEMVRVTAAHRIQ